MRTDFTLRWIAIGCAIFLMFGLFADRTSWVRGGTTLTDSAGYNWTALFSGVVALAALVIAFRARLPVDVSVLGGAVAVAAFGASAYASGSYWLALSRGDARVDGIEMMPEKWTVHPASGPPFFALAALIGAISALALAVLWLRQPNGEALPRASFG